VKFNLKQLILFGTSWTTYPPCCVSTAVDNVTGRTSKRRAVNRRSVLNFAVTRMQPAINIQNSGSGMFRMPLFSSGLRRFAYLVRRVRSPGRAAMCIDGCHLSMGGSVAEWLACWTQAQKGPGSNRSRDTVG